MIRYIKGSLMKAEKGRIVVLAGGIGYEVMLPEIVWQNFQHSRKQDECIELFISYHQTVQQPKPVLIGFSTEVEQEFFELLLKVKDIGPVMASRALTLPVPVIARAIEDRDAGTLMKLKGVGRRKADMIISELNGRAGKFALIKDGEKVENIQVSGDFSRQVVDVLVKQLGHPRADAKKMVSEAMVRCPEVLTPEELFEEVYRGTKNSS
jgi:Holliday junction DNA helicase RuvA